MTSLYVQVYSQQFYDSVRNVQGNQLNFIATEFINQPIQSFTYDYGTTNTTSSPKVFDNDTDAITYYSPFASIDLLSDVNGYYPTPYYSTCDIEFVEAPVGAAFASLTFDDISNGSINVAFTATDSTKLSTLATVATSGNYNDLSSKPTIPAAQVQSDWNETNASSLDYLKNKPSLSAVATTGAYSSLSGTPTIPVVQAYDGNTQRLGAFPIFNSAAVSSGVAVFYLTADGTSTGTALFLNSVITNSVSVTPNDATSLYGFSWVFSNSNKTLTVTVNKSSATGVISLLGLNLLGSPIAAANGTTVKLTVWGY